MPSPPTPPSDGSTLALQGPPSANADERLSPHATLTHLLALQICYRRAMQKVDSFAPAAAVSLQEMDELLMKSFHLFKMQQSVIKEQLEITNRLRSSGVTVGATSAELIHLDSASNVVQKHFTLASNLFDDTIMSEFKKVAAAETRRRRTPLGPTSSGSGSSFPPASPDFGSVAEDLFFSQA